jgi:hypothetical protein
MKFRTRSRIAIAAAVLATGALLGPAAPATAAYPICMPDHCDTLVRYFSDASYSQLVGEYGSEVCGYVEWGTQTDYVRTVRRYC